MVQTNFTANDFKKDKTAVKVARSKRDVYEKPQPTSTPIVQKEADPDAVPQGTTPEVMSWVDSDPERAQKALDAELADNRPRKGLVSSLQEIVDAAKEEDAEEDDESGDATSDEVEES